MLKVQVARVSGFCGQDGRFGVSGAIRLAQEAALNYPGKVYLVGDLVHNQHVTAWLRDAYRIKIVKNLDQVPAGKVVVIKAHGATPEFINQAQAKKIRLIDATCPMVKAAQTLVKKLVDEGKKVIYVASSKDHDEALSVTKQVTTGVQIVTLAELADLVIKKPAHTVVLTQTTLSLLETRAQFARLQKKYPLLTIKPHLCQATTQRQQAVLELAAEVDFLLVVGAPHSSNSARLLEVARTTGKPAQAVNDESELDANWFQGCTKVGVIAGASTPDWVTKKVIAALRQLDPGGREIPLAAQKPPLFLTGLGQDSHRLVPATEPEVLTLGGVAFACGLQLEANSNGDVMLHALCNALSTALGGTSLSLVADPLCQQGVKDSQAYLEVFLRRVEQANYYLSNLSVSVQAARPKLQAQFTVLQQSLSRLVGLPPNRVGLAFTSDEGLSACGQGEGISATVSVLLAHT